jgi:hypothetical protein
VALAVVLTAFLRETGPAGTTRVRPAMVTT